MLRSLFAGVSGLANHQIKLDVIGNNIANINTVGFKASRVTFREMLTQTIRGASRPLEGGAGGTNPLQVGLGSAIGSVDTNFSQGNMQITGVMTDMAIEGEGFFVLTDGYTNYYTRGGAFSLDGSGHLVNPANGYKLQGLLADEFGVIEHGRGIEDIVLPTAMVVPARATTRVDLSGNLNVDSDALATITRSEHLLAVAESSDMLLSLYRETGVRINLQEGVDIAITGKLTDVATTTETNISAMFTVDPDATLQDLADEIEAALQTVDPDATVAVLPDGSIQVTASANYDINNLVLQVGGNTNFNNAFKFDMTISAGTTGLTRDELLAPAVESDLLANLFDHSGRRLNIVDGEDILLNGDLGGLAITTRMIPYSEASTTVSDLLTGIEQAFNINFGEAVIDSQGRVEITGDVGADFSISSVSITQSDGNSVFDHALAFTSIQEARDAGAYTATTLIYDSLGGVHNMTITFTKVDGENRWNWEASVDGLGEIIEGGAGYVQFSETGTLTSFAYNSGAGRLIIEPNNGAGRITISMDPGTIGGLDGLIQYDRAFSVRAKDLDGQAMGMLESISIDRNGVINGQFSNGVNRDLAQITMADFNNPSGLMRVGENMFIISPNSGSPVIVFAGSNARGQISPGELEMSNVDLAGEFTEMIIAQRGFQANARIISVGDQMLSELVNLKK